MVSVLQQGLESVRAVKAFDRQDLEETHLKDVSMRYRGGFPEGQESKIPAFSGGCPDCFSVYSFRPLAGCAPGADRSHDTRRV